MSPRDTPKIATLPGPCAGSKVNNYSYDPYGINRAKTEAIANPFEYTGGQLDDTTGLYKLGIRYYDPTLGRFTQPDPTGQDPYYTYARNSPCNYIDPSGAASDPAGCAISVLAILGGTAAIIGGAAATAGTGGLGAVPGFAAAFTGATALAGGIIGVGAYC